MNNSCEIIPSRNGKPSQLFTDLLNITENRTKAGEIYSLVTVPEVQEALGLESRDDLGEPKIDEIFEKAGNPKTFLGDTAYRKYIVKKEGLDNSFSTFDDAFSKLNGLISEYQDYAFNIIPEGNDYKIVIKDKAAGIEGMRNTVFNGTLQNSLLRILRSLGFDVQADSTVGNPNRFSPLNARRNADGLREVIRIAKGQKGEEAFPEEFAHVMIEGLQRHPLVRRLLDTLDDTTVQSILGDSFESYKSLYKGNKELLRKEAAGKILAQSIVDKSHTPLSSRIYNLSLDRLSQAQVEDVANAIVAAEEAADSLAESLDESDTYAFFSKEDVLRGNELSSLSAEVKELEKAAEDAYKTLSRKMRISSTRSKVRRPDSRENKALANMREQLNKKDYTSSVFSFLNYVLDDVEGLYARVREFNELYKKDKGFKPAKISQSFKLLNRIKDSLIAYSDVVARLGAVSEMENIKDALSEEDIQSIEEKASQVTMICNNLKKLYENSRRNTVFEFYHNWLGTDRILGRDGTGISLNDILDQAPHDVTDLSRLINSMEDSSDTLLALTDNILKKVLHIRDRKTMQIVQAIRAIHDKYFRETGSRDTSFMYERDSDGKLTGMLISDISFADYYKDRKNYIQSMKDRGLSQEEISASLETWELNHTKVVTNELGKKERLPKQELYPSDALNKLNDAQRTYYQSMVEMKQLCDSMLPSRYIRTFRAVQKRASAADSVLTSKSPKQALQQLKGAFVKSWIRTADDTEQGMNELTVDPVTGELTNPVRSRNVLLDFAGNPISRVPVYYIGRLEDMNSLSTDFTDSLLAYAGMAVNYNELAQVADAMEIIKDFIGDRDVVQNVGKNRLIEKIRGVDGKMEEYPVVKKGYDSKIYKTFEGYLKRNIYGRRKDENRVYIGNKEINFSKIGDNFKWYTTLIGMGYNIFSFGSNVTMGNAQLVSEAFGGQWDKSTFNLKDLAKGMAFYTKHMGSTFVDRYRDIKKDKLTLLLREFDPQEDTIQELADSNTAQGLVKKTMSIFSPLQGMSAGEHYLHSIVMAAYLNHIKVKVGDTTMSLLEAYDTHSSEITVGKAKTGMNDYKLKLPDNATFEDGSPITEEALFNIKRKIQVISHRINGAYSEIDKGQLNNNVLGRMLLQYRQWMPAFYMSRFKTSRYNAANDRMEEGYYLTVGKFMWQNIKDIGDLKFQLGTRWKQLNPYQRANIMKAVYELGFFAILTALLRHTGFGEPDDDDTYAMNYLRYMAYRLRLELGSGAPSLSLFENMMTLVQTPVPAMEKMDSLLNLLNFTDIGQTIETGKYAGWNRYLRNLYNTVPFARNIGRTVELGQGSFDMFNPYMD